MLSLSKYLKTGKLLLVVCLFLSQNTLISQTNLIHNSSFELYNNIPSFNTGNGLFFDNSTRIVLDWDVYSSPDYYSTAYTYTYTFKGIPTNTFGSIYPKQGSAYAGFYTFLKSTDSKEYIYQHLYNSLKADTIYCVSYFVSKADRANYSIKNFGVYFSINTPTVNAMGFINAIPQVLNNVYVNDTINWVEIQGCFTAQGGENYITIGNFNSNLNTDTLNTGTTNPFSSGGSDNSYYYIDSITLWQNNFPTFIKENSKDELVSVYPNPTEGRLSLALSVGKEIEPDKCAINITDVLGREVLVSEYKEHLDVSFLEEGIYFVSIYEKERLIGINKIIKKL